MRALSLLVTLLTAAAPAAVPAPHTSGASMPESHREGDAVWVRGPAPRLTAYLTDPAGGSLAAEFEVDHDPAVPAQGTGLIWTATTPPSTNPKPSLRMPGGLAQDDWRIRWRARAHNTTAGTVSAWSPWKSGTVSTAVPEIGAPEGVLRDGWRLRWRIQAYGGPFASQTAWREFTVDVE